MINLNAEESGNTPKTIHVFVALCDNQYQGIIKVPPTIGNGQDPANNLYWGAAFGVKTFFSKSSEWKLIKTLKIDSIVLERLIFKHRTADYYLVADAFDGRNIKECIHAFLYSASGIKKNTINVNGVDIGINGNANLLSYVGHEGLMDFQMTETFPNADNRKRDCIILACISKNYFFSHLQTAKATPLIWTTGLMCPEAYTLHDAITGYIKNESSEQIRMRGVRAYMKYQKCSEKSAKDLLVSGW